MPQKLTMTLAGTGKPFTCLVSNMFYPLAQTATVEDFGIYKSRHNGPITSESKNVLFPLLLNNTISAIQLQYPKKTIFVLHSPEEIKKAVAGNVSSLHMNDALFDTYNKILRQIERTTKPPYVVARFGLPEAVGSKHPDFRTLPRTIPQIRGELAAKKPLGLINPLSDLRVFTNGEANRHFTNLLKAGV